MRGHSQPSGSVASSPAPLVSEQEGNAWESHSEKTHGELGFRPLDTPGLLCTRPSKAGGLEITFLNCFPILVLETAFVGLVFPGHVLENMGFMLSSLQKRLLKKCVGSDHQTHPEGGLSLPHSQAPSPGNPKAHPCLHVPPQPSTQEARGSSFPCRGHHHLPTSQGPAFLPPGPQSCLQGEEPPRSTPLPCPWDPPPRGPWRRRRGY